MVAGARPHPKMFGTHSTYNNTSSLTLKLSERSLLDRTFTVVGTTSTYVWLLAREHTNRLAGLGTHEPSVDNGRDSLLA